MMLSDWVEVVEAGPAGAVVPPGGQRRDSILAHIKAAEFERREPHPIDPIVDGIERQLHQYLHQRVRQTATCHLSRTGWNRALCHRRSGRRRAPTDDQGGPELGRSLPRRALTTDTVRAAPSDIKNPLQARRRRLPAGLSRGPWADRDIGAEGTACRAPTFPGSQQICRGAACCARLHSPET